jgi:hypothetical protein
MSDEGVERVIHDLELRYIFNFTLLYFLSHFILGVTGALMKRTQSISLVVVDLHLEPRGLL